MKHGAGGEWILASKKKSNQRGTGHVTNSLCRKDYCLKSLRAEAAATASSTRTRAVARPTPPTCLQADWYSAACEPPPPLPPPLSPFFCVMHVFHFRVRQWQGVKETAIDGFTKEERNAIKKKKRKEKSTTAHPWNGGWGFLLSPSWSF